MSMTDSNQEPAGAAITIGVSKSRRKHALIIAGFLAVIGFGSFIAGEGYVPDHELGGGVCGAVAVLVLMVSRGAWTEGVAMTIGDEGIWYRDWNLPVVPWRHIDRAYATGIRLRPLLRIDLVNAQTFFGGLDDEIRGRLPGNTLIKANHLLAPNGALEMPIAEVVAEIGAALRRRTDS